MRVCDIIRRKRDGEELSGEELIHVVTGFLAGSIPDYQVAALLMAICIRGMTDKETLLLTKILLSSGIVLDLSDIDGPKIGRASTGGVGDKAGLILAPLLAAAGVTVPVIAARGIGHTGGTLDRLSAIPGLRTDVPLEEFHATLRKIGCAVTGGTDELAPAERMLHALRDVTATADSIPLIAACIMSRKLAEGLDGLVIDVKVGQGGLVKGSEDARRLGQSMVRIGNAMGVRTVAVLTSMEQPLGMAIGSSLEVRECMTALRGRWSDDLKEVTLTLGAWMIKVASKAADFEFVHQGREYGGLFDYRDGLMELLKDGTAREKFLDLVAEQHGSLLSRAKQILLPKASQTRYVPARRTGYVRRLSGEKTGNAVALLGGARKTLHDSFDYAAGIVLAKKIGDYVEAGQPLAVLHYSPGAEAEAAEEVFLSGIEIGREAIEPRDPIIGVIQ